MRHWRRARANRAILDRGRALPLALLASLAAPTAALARAGGGSGGFHGGGSSGGGFHGGGSSGGGYYGGSGHASGAALAIVFGVIVLFVVLYVVFAVLLKDRNVVRGLKRRRRAVEAAAAEAAQDDPEFATERVRSGATSLFKDIERAWDREDRATLERLLGPELLAEWTRRLDDFKKKGWHNSVEVEGDPEVWYVGIRNLEGEADDRVVVRIKARIRDWVKTPGGIRYEDGAASSEVKMDEYWTLGRRDGRWILLSIEQPKEGEHELREAIVATPWAAEGRLHDEAVIEQAVADAAPNGQHVAELASLDFAGDARAQALDLSLVDGRFAPDVLETEVRRAIAAWAEAIDSDRGDLSAVASPAAEQELLYGRDATRKTRVVVRGPQVRRVTLASLDGSADPPRMVVELEVRGARYVEDRDTTTVVSGSKTRETTFTERWTLTLGGDGEHPWRVAETAAAAA
jgi:predicted lipid-binding transport protein (Tim44 family)